MTISWMEYLSNECCQSSVSAYMTIFIVERNLWNRNLRNQAQSVVVSYEYFSVLEMNVNIY